MTTTTAAGIPPAILNLHPYGLELIIAFDKKYLDDAVDWFIEQWADDETEAEEARDYGEFIKNSKSELRGSAWASQASHFPYFMFVNLPLFMKHDMDFALLTSVIAHEAFHIVMSVSEHIGEYPKTQAEEPMAYLLGYIVEHAMKLMPAELPGIADIVNKAATEEE